MKRETTFLLYCDLLNSLFLPAKLGEFSRCLSIPARDEKRSRPKQNQRNTCRNGIVRRLFILHPGDTLSVGRHTARLFR